MEKLFVPLFKEFKADVKLNDANGTFQRLTYKDSLLKYGTDKPDLRIPVEIKDLTPLFAKSEYQGVRGQDRPCHGRSAGVRSTPAPGLIIFRKKRRNSARLAWPMSKSMPPES